MVSHNGSRRAGIKTDGRVRAWMDTLLTQRMMKNRSVKGVTVFSVITIVVICAVRNVVGMDIVEQ